MVKRLQTTRALSFYKIWPWMTAIIAFIVAINIFHHYGITWDEGVQSHYGELVLDYYRSGFSNKACNTFIDLKYYGPSFELATSAIYQFLPQWKYEIRHFFISLMALLTIIGIIKYGGLFKKVNIAGFSAVCLILLPRFLGHAFNNSKDIPFACCFLWSMYMISLLFRDEKCKWSTAILCGISIGTALSIRTGGFLLFAFLLAATGFQWSKRVAHLKMKFFSGVFINDLLKLSAIIMIAWGIMISVWPWAYESPILNPIRSFKMLTAFHNAYPVLFEGKVYASNQLPRYYLLKYLIITTPPLILFFFISGVIFSIRHQRKQIMTYESYLYVLLQLWFFFPLCYFMVRQPNVYDGIRHFLFILPAMAIFSGIGITGLIHLLKPKLQKGGTAVIIILLIMAHIPTIIQLHPYQMTYYNCFTGGMEKAGKIYDTDYWVSSYKEASEWINRDALNDSEVTVLVAANSYNSICAEYYLDPKVKVYKIFQNVTDDKLPENFNYYISTTRYGLDKNFPKTPVVHFIGRMGMVYTVIKKRD